MEQIHREISDLKGTRTHEELAAKLESILRSIMWYVSQSEGALLDEREAWHTEYSDALYSDAGMARATRAGSGLHAGGAPRHQPRVPMAQAATWSPAELPAPPHAGGQRATREDPLGPYVPERRRPAYGRGPSLRSAQA